MAIDFGRNYSPPGVYIDETASTVISTTGIPPTLVAIVGPSQGFQTNTEQVVLSDTSVRLSKQGIDTDSAVVTVANTGVSVPAADYSLTPTVPGAGGTQDYYVDMLAAADPTTPVGTVVFITYNYTDPTYFDPKHFDSYEDVKDAYGEPLNTAVADPSDVDYQYVVSPLSLAAMLAFQNGATELWLGAAAPPTGDTDAALSTSRRSNLAAAYTKLATNAQITVIVALTDGIGTADAGGALTDLKTALTTAANDDYFRFGVTGFDPDVDTAPDTLLNTAGAASKRMMLAYASPSGLLMYSGTGNATFPIGHQYLAAAYAGRMAALPVQEALTKQVMAGFSGVAGTPLSNSLKNQYAAAGVAISEIDRFSRLVVRHGVTTDPTNVNTREAAVVRAKDAMVTALQDGMDTSGLIGSPINDDLLLSVKSAVSGILDTATADDVIVSYTGLAVRQTSIDPSVVEVKFAYRPAYPLNYIVISFSIDMTTGSTTDLNTDETVA